jgi:hypothetical protein
MPNFPKWPSFYVLFILLALSSSAVVAEQYDDCKRDVERIWNENVLGGQICVMKCSVPLLFYGKYRPIFILSNGYGERRGENGVPEDAEDAMRAERRQHGRTTPPGGREAEKRVLWGHMAAVYAGRAENSAWVAYAVQHLLNSLTTIGTSRSSNPAWNPF